ncbi:MAG: aspartyl/glutamyl-tRNA amidotransferase subunit A [Haloquadratum walsbyi J07HQW2]|uniref:Glutamyl-tRNA(Gln) amidotransferase subunit A n=2 Tax=Haloquadratum walsbyi TaxID=293091 RepID=U1PSD7_9EURY|nr:amidase family protein [Haloquadratum walsbyi]ERG96717.1 MAG: aspartyl/glutamyl-tRNA amidotransferase subunit A [Haloquadratum walsbyi J07HQW2]
MDLNAFITAEEIDPEVESETEAKPALGDVTVAVKDNISTAGVRTTCGSAMLSSYVPPYDATVVERLKQAGATIVGKTNMDEFGMGGTTETSAYGPTKNPVDTGHVPGGSSGGSAAAVASGAADIALGSDTGGSVRNPAAFCGVVGIKPTYGLVSRYGLIAYANSLEQIGPIAPTVREAAELLDVIAGPDPHDATTRFDSGEISISGVDTLQSESESESESEASHPATTRTYAAAVDQDVSGMTVGVVTDLLDDADDRVVETFREAIAELESQGLEIVEVSLDSLEHAVQAYYVIAMSEASSNLARFDGVRYGPGGGDGDGDGESGQENIDKIVTDVDVNDGNWNDAFAAVRDVGFGEEVKRRILLGTYALSAGYHEKYYEKAQDAREWVKQDFESAFETADVLATPTMPVLPPAIGESIDDPLKLYLMDANTVPVNLANLPAVSVPAGEVDGLPVGLQVIGPAFGEELIIQAAAAVE